MNKIDELLKNEKVEWKKLGEVCEIRAGNSFPKHEQGLSNGEYPFYKVADMNKTDIYMGKADNYISNETLTKLKCKTAPKESIIFPKVGATLSTNKKRILSEESCFDNNIFALIPKNVNPKYLYYVFSMTTLLEFSNGQSAVPSIDRMKLENFEIPIPSIETQEKIVKILDKFTNYVMELQTELQTELQKRTKQYEYYRDMLLSEEYLNKISEKIFMQSNNIVKKFKLIEIVELNRGKRVVKSELAENAKYPVFQNSLTPLGYYDYKNFEGGKTCIITAGAAGEIFYQDKDFWAADDVFVLTTNNILNKYLYYFLLNKQCLLKSKVRKASIPRLSRDDIEKIEILFPPIEIQNKVVEILDKFQSLLSDTKGLLPHEIEQRQKQYEYYREKLLTFDENCVKREREREHISLIRI